MLDDTTLRCYCSEVLLDTVGSFGSGDENCWICACVQVMILNVFNAKFPHNISKKPLFFRLQIHF